MLCALDQWRAALSADRVRTTEAELAAATACTFAWPRRVVAILVPGNLAQVRDILRIAAAARHPVYPYSRGCNWGLGSRLPTADGCALIDLSAMNRVLDYDPRLGTLTVEPGVHFAQAAAFLKQQRSDFYCSVTGGPAYGSLIGNALERGGGDGPYGDRGAHMAAVEIVLAGGEVVRTGFDRYPNASTAQLSRTGVGPSLTELVTQSGFGVVTRATFWLARRPAVRFLVNATLGSTATLAPAVDALRGLLQTRVLYPHGATIWSSYKLLARDGRFPWRAPGAPPLDLEAVDGAEPWYLSASVEGPSAAVAQALLAEVRQQLQPHAAELRVLREDEMGADERDTTALGQPTGENVFSAYWRKKTELPALEDVDPDRDRCGVIWACPSMPLDGAAVVPAVAAMEALIKAHGLEPNIGLNPVSPRLLEVYAALMFDRDVAGEDGRAMACHDALMRALIAKGHLPYRLGVQSMHLLPAPADDSAALMRRLKAAFDPHHVIAPGRYDF